MKKRKALAMGILVGSMVVALAGCGDDSKKPANDSETDSGFTSESESETDSESESEPTTEVVDGYTYTILDKQMWTIDVLNIRDLPRASGEKIGQFPFGTEVHVTGQCKESGWYRVDYDGGVGYVSNDYMSDEEPEGSLPPVDEPGEPNPTTDEKKDFTGKKVNDLGNVYLMGNAGFEAYSYSDSAGDKYASLIKRAADALAGVSNVYSMPIPLGSGVVMPEEYKSKVHVADQKKAIDSILGHMGDKVHGVNIYDELYAHRDEYIYFRTDHHWTQLGAYYAYTQFCEEKGITPKSLDSYKHKAYEGFVGSFYFNAESKPEALHNAPDTVYTYGPASRAVMTYTTTKGESFEWPIINNVNSYGPGLKYSTFIGADNPYTIIENKDIKDGSSCIVVKDSFGNAFVPFLVDHYETVYVIDQRYYKGSVIELAKKNKVTDVIFANNLSAIGSSAQQKLLNGILK